MLFLTLPPTQLADHKASQMVIDNSERTLEDVVMEFFSPKELEDGIDLYLVGAYSGGE